MRRLNRRWLPVLLAVPALAAQPVAVVIEGELAAPARYGLNRLEEALRAKSFEVRESASTAQAGWVVLAGVGAGSGAVARTLRAAGVALPEGAEALVVRRATYQGKPALVLCGADARGLMYAALDAAERVAWGSDPRQPFAPVRDTAERPYLAERGISIYTMQRAYFESHLYDEGYWRRYFDLLAASRINSFVVIFGYENGGYMAPMYPYFFDVAAYPGVQVPGLTREQQERNTAAFNRLIRLAHERGIEVTAGIWDHIYRGGVQGGGIPGASENAGKRVNGLVWGVTAENLAGYTKAALARFLEVFPEIDAIQFRMHSESGLKPEEMAGFWHEVFGFIRRVRPNLRLDLRAKDLPDAVIDDALAQGLNARVSTKFWMEQMGLPFHPTHINAQNQKDRRHGYADLLTYPQRYRVHWQLWSGGTTRLLLWGDPEYVRRFASAARLYDGNSFEINEMLATRMLGEPHDTPPTGILDARYKYYDYEFERYWYFYRLWGRLTYNPQASPEVWQHEFERRFGPAGVHVRNALEAASQVLPRIVAAAYRYSYFPTTRGWAEMNHQDDLAKFAGEEGSDTQQFLSPRDEARRIMAGGDTAMRRPAETAAWFAGVADRIEAEVARARAASGDQGKEFTSTVTDVGILAGLARYYARRLPAAVAYNLYRESGSVECLDDALAGERQAVAAWREIVAAAGDVYNADLAFGAHAVGFRRHWKEELGLAERDYQKLLAERVSPAAARAGVKRPEVPAPAGPPPMVKLEPTGAAIPGTDLMVRAAVSAPAGVRRVTLRYRHLTQYEDYATAEMRLDARTGRYVGRIPGAFILPRWDMMYFVEAVDQQGAGRMYPDFDVGAPYVIVSVKR